MNVLTIQGGSLYTNCYMVWGDDSNQCVLIDPGFQAEQILEQVRIHGKEVEAVLLTHGHFDHLGGVKGIAAETGCKIYLHEDDLSLPSQLTLGTIPYTDSYEEGDVLSLAGVAFTVMHTPGHTPGSVCLICENALFAGDTLFACSCGRTDLPGGDHRAMRKSLARLASLEEDYQVFSGHGDHSRLSVEKRLNPYLQ